VQLAGEPDAERKFLETRNAVFKGDHIIADFPEVIGTPLHRGPCLCGQQLTQRGLSPLDLARQNGLTANEWPDQNMGIGKPSAFSRQPSYKSVRI
jgi:hypothetical protein